MGTTNDLKFIKLEPEDTSWMFLWAKGKQSARQEGNTAVHWTHKVCWNSAMLTKKTFIITQRMKKCCLCVQILYRKYTIPKSSAAPWASLSRPSPHYSKWKQPVHQGAAILAPGWHWCSAKPPSPAEFSADSVFVQPQTSTSQLHPAERILRAHTAAARNSSTAIRRAQAPAALPTDL